MCGIFGYINFRNEELGKARNALHTLTHRGPDQWGEYLNENIYLGHRRLSILDLSENGKQPMHDNEHRIIITVNGEIYNYAEIKKELMAKYKFNSTSDSEVLIHGYKEWGIRKLIDKIDGMYAFCLYDKLHKKIYLVRDRAGIKPLYYSVMENKIMWASELKAIQHFFQGKLTIDYTAIYDYLTYLYIPAPKTMYKNVHKLCPAHYMEIDMASGKHTIHKYWNLSGNERAITVEDAKSELQRLVAKSVNEQMMSDVPVGFFLSGGMDSSTVVAAAAKTNAQLQTFSIGFDNQEHSETHYARLVAEKYNCRHNEKILGVNEAAVLLAKMKTWYDEPFADTSAMPTYLVSEFARKNVTVTLTGDGGDEIFGGYGWYQKYRDFTRQHVSILEYFMPAVQIIKNSSMPFFFKRVANFVQYRFLIKEYDLYAALLGGLIKQEKVRYARRWNIASDYDDYWHFREHDNKDFPLFTRLQYLDFHTYLPGDILTKVDRVSMAVSLEARVPLLSRELVEFAFSLPQEVRWLNGKWKGLMKETYAKALPATIIERKKKGFSVPMHTWRKAMLKDCPTPQEYLLTVFGIE